MYMTENNCTTIQILGKAPIPRKPAIPLHVHNPIMAKGTPKTLIIYLKLLEKTNVKKLNFKKNLPLKLKLFINKKFTIKVIK